MTYADTLTSIKKHSEEMQTQRAGCSKVEPKIFTPLQTPFPGHGTPKIKSAGDGHYLYLRTQFGENARNFELS